MQLPISAQQFLAEYWQQKPLYLPQAIPGFRSPITPDELAGFALDADIESRLIWQDKGIWGQADGPFIDTSFQRQDLWTLLVQQMDRWHPAIHQLRLSLSFLPNWRFDDVMVSYAPPGGSVGRWVSGSVGYSVGWSFDQLGANEGPTPAGRSESPHNYQI